MWYILRRRAKAMRRAAAAAAAPSRARRADVRGPRWVCALGVYTAGGARSHRARAQQQARAARL